MAFSNEELVDKVMELILSGGRRTTAANVRALANDIIASYLNTTNGGNVIKALCGYEAELTPTDPRHFITKKYFEENGGVATWGNIEGYVEMQEDLVNYIAAQIADIPSPDLTALWNLDGNVLTERGNFGSTGDAFGWNIKVGDVTVGGVTDDGRAYHGTNSAFADTMYSILGGGNTSATYGWQVQNSDNSARAWFRNDGLFSLYNDSGGTAKITAFDVYSNDGSRGVFGISSSNYANGNSILPNQTIIYGAGNGLGFFTDNLPIYFGNVASNNNLKYTPSSDTIELFGNDTSSVGESKFNMINNVGRSFTMANTSSGYSANNLGPGCGYFYSDGLGGMAYVSSLIRFMFPEAGNFSTGLRVEERNIGLNGNSYGGGVGVMFIANAGTNPSANPTGGYVQYGNSGVPTFRLSNGNVINLQSETTAVAQSSYTHNSSSAIHTGDVFAGYTLRQVVQALVNRGILT